MSSAWRGGGGGRGTDIGPGETSEAQQRLAISHVQISILGRHGEIIPKRVPGFCETGFFVYYTILPPPPGTSMRVRDVAFAVSPLAPFFGVQGGGDCPPHARG